MPHLSECLERFAPSRIGEVYDLAQRLAAEGQQIFDLSAGEPDFESVAAACAAGHAAIDGGDTKYTSVDGTAKLKAAIRRKLVKDGHPAYPDDRIAVGSGAKPLLAHIFMTLLNPGDQVIIPGPCWTSHPGMVQILGAQAVIPACTAEAGYKLDAAGLEAALNPATRALILCSPGNPTGAVYSAEELRALAAVLADHPDVWIVADEIYGEITFDGRAHVSAAVAAPALAERIITVNGVSKGYAMTGWRIGYAAGPAPVMAGLRQVMSQVAGSPSSIGQAAAAAALDGPQAAILERREIYQARRDAVLGWLGQVQELRPAKPEGAFYIFVDCSGALGRRTPGGQVIQSSADLARYFLEHSGVAVVPGEAFETEAAFRLSFACGLEVLEGACAGIRAACRDLS